MKKFFVIIIALIFFSTFSSAQSANPPAATPSTVSINQCIKDNGCANSDLACRAKCAGVPNPSPGDIQDTDSCISLCPNTTTTDYENCRNKCIDQHYSNPSAFSTTSPVAPTPTGTATNSTISGTGAGAQKPTSTPSPISAALSLSQLQTNLYFALLLAILVTSGMMI